MENDCLTVKLDPKFLENRLEASVIFNKSKGLYYVKILEIGSNNAIWIQLNPSSDLSGKSLGMAKEQNFQIQKEPAPNPKACDAGSAFDASVE